MKLYDVCLTFQQKVSKQGRDERTKCSIQSHHSYLSSSYMYMEKISFCGGGGGGGGGVVYFNVLHDHPNFVSFTILVSLILLHFITLPVTCDN